MKWHLMTPLNDLFVDVTRRIMMYWGICMESSRQLENQGDLGDKTAWGANLACEIHWS
jgi:hypothetical protein